MTQMQEVMQKTKIKYDDARARLAGEETLPLAECVLAECVAGQANTHSMRKECENPT